MNTTTSTVKRYIALAKAVGSLRRCQEKNNTEWATKHANAILELMEDAPSGSGFDSGTHIEDESTGDKLVFTTSYHHMNDGGYYDGWTEHKVILTPSFEVGYHTRITGPDRNGIKEYISDQFGYWLDEDVPQWTGYEPIAEPAAQADS